MTDGQTDWQTVLFYIERFTQILEVNLLAFACRLFHEDFSPIYGALQIYMELGSNFYATISAVVLIDGVHFINIFIEAFEVKHNN